MFLSGVKMDIGMVQGTGRKALWTGTSSILLPLVVGMLAVKTLSRPEYRLAKDQVSNLPFAIVVHCLSSFPVTASILEELKMVNSEIGRLGLSAALVSEVSNIFLTAICSLLKIYTNKGLLIAVIATVSSIVYVAFVAFAIRPAIYWMVRQTPEGRPVKETYIGIIMIMVLVSGLLSNRFGQSFLFGPFILGIAVPEGPPLGTALVNRLEIFVFNVLLPLFVTMCAVRTDFRGIDFRDKATRANDFLIMVTLIVKFLECMIPPLFCKVPLADAFAVALILSCKGIVQLNTYTFFKDNTVCVYTYLQLYLVYIFSVKYLNFFNNICCSSSLMQRLIWRCVSSW